MPDFTAYSSYQAYIDDQARAIRGTHQANEYHSLEDVVALMSPRLHSPVEGKAKQGILLIHGLLDSCYGMQSLYDYFVSQGFAVATVLLPGHGTEPADLMKITHHDWTEAITFALEKLKAKAERVSVLGVSTGANLAIQCAQNDKTIHRLLLFSPALRIRHPLVFISQYHRYFAWLGHHSKWYRVLEEDDFSRYNSICYNGIEQVHRLAKSILKKPVPKQPMLMILSQDDEVVSTPAGLHYLKKQQQLKSKAIIYHKHPPATQDAQCIYRSSHYPEERILDFSHIGLAVGPDHPQYGVNGKLDNFHHYSTWLGQKLKPKRTSPVYSGALSLHNLRNYYFKRLTYNPDFSYLTEAMKDFLLA